MSDTKENKDLLGKTYQYCIQQFAAYEGVKGGEFYTPESIVKTIVAILKPYENCRVYDPCCGSGGMFVQSADFIEAHRDLSLWARVKRRYLENGEDEYGDPWYRCQLRAVPGRHFL